MTTTANAGRQVREDKQGRLIFERGDKLKLLDDMAGRPPQGVTRPMWKSVIGVLKAVELTAGNDGSTKRQAVLSAKSALSVRQLRRAIACAERLGLLAVDRKPLDDFGHYATNRYRPQWETVKKMSSAPAIMSSAPAIMSSAPAIMSSGHCHNSNDSNDLRQDFSRLPKRVPQIPSSSTGALCERSNEADSEWGEKKEELRKLGVDQFEEAIRCCQERGLTPGMVAADIEHWQARRAQWEKPLGVLYQRLKSGLDWIAPSEAWQAAQNRKARDAERAKQSQRMEAERRQRAQEKAEEDKLERDFGRVLDGLAKEDRDRLAAVVCADKPYLRSAYERGDWKADGDSVWLRSELLKTLREEWQQRPRAVPA